MRKILLYIVILSSSSGSLMAGEEDKMVDAWASFYNISEHELKLAEHGFVDMQHKAYLHFNAQKASDENTVQANKWKQRALDNGHETLVHAIYKTNKTKAFLSSRSCPTDIITEGAIEFCLATSLIKQNKNLLQAQKLLRKAQKNEIAGAEEALNNIDPRQLGIAYYQKAMLQAQITKPGDTLFHTHVVNRLQEASKRKITEAELALVQVYSNKQYEFANTGTARYHMERAADQGHIDAQFQVGRYSLLFGDIFLARKMLTLAFDSVIAQGKKHILQSQVFPSLQQVPIGSQIAKEHRNELQDVQRKGHELLTELKNKIR